MTADNDTSVTVTWEHPEDIRLGPRDRDIASTTPGSCEYQLSYNIPLQIIQVLEYFLHLTSYLHQAPPTRSLAIHTL